ncbi:MAG: hypothetical protein WC994_06640 [Brumimicrobium sp.]
MSFKISKPFIIREALTPNALKLIKSVVLGSNGTRYQHQMVDKRIQQLYKPIYLNLERNENVLGNITLCRRPKNWYLRYFAFEVGLQSSIKSSRSKGKNSILKQTIKDFFDDVLNQPEVETLYAYIDPKNERSLWISQSFGFKSISKIATQTFSRIKPKNQKNVSKSKINSFIREKVEKENKDKSFYFSHHTFNDEPFYVYKESGEIVAFAKVFKEEWKMERLPGKFGGVLIKVVPYIPFLRKIVKPQKHVFSVVDSVWCKHKDAAVLQRLFEGILHEENTNSLIWWVDKNEGIYKQVQDKVPWGLLHKVSGVREVDLVVKTKKTFLLNLQNKPTYITGFDFI